MTSAAATIAQRQRQVRCMKCDALPGDPCVSSAGKRLSHVHVIRQKRARRTGMDKAVLPRHVLAAIAGADRARRTPVRTEPPG